jgi:transposase
MQKIPKQEYTAEFKELAVRRVKDGQAVGAVAKELGLIEQTLRNWVKAFAAGKLNGPGTRKVTPEEMELSRLRAENIRLKRDN